MDAPSRFPSGISGSARAGSFTLLAKTREGCQWLSQRSLVLIMKGSAVLRWLVPAALAALLAIPVQTAGARGMGGGGMGGGMHMGGGGGMGGWGGGEAWAEEEGLVGEEWVCAVARQCHLVSLVLTG